MRVILATTIPKPVEPDSLAWRADGLIRKSLEMWQRQSGQLDDVSIFCGGVFYDADGDMAACFEPGPER